MRKGMLLGAAGLGVALLAGCSSSSTPGNAVTRVLVGFVYVTKNDGGAYTGPSAFIMPHNSLKSLNPGTANEVPLDVPTAGTVTLTMANGTLTKAPATLSFDLSQSNEIICSAGGAANALVTLTVAAPIMNGTVVKTLSVPTISLGTLNGTVLGIQSPNTPTYTPGAPDGVQVRLQTTKGIGGVPALGAPLDADQMMTSNGTGLGTGFMSGQVYDVAAAVFDKNGVVITGASTTLASSDITRVGTTPGVLTPVLGQTAGDVQITVSVVGATLVSQTFHGPYNPGTATAVTLLPAGPTDLLWAAAGPAATQALTATVMNEVGAAMPNVTVNLSSNKESAPSSNIWGCGAFVSATNVFTPNTGLTNASGQLATVVTAPTSTGALPAGNPAKGHATMTATAGTATGQAIINITRPLGSLTITGPSGLDVGTLSGDPNVLPLPATTVRVTGAFDIDGDAVISPTVVWNIVNTAAGGNLVGNTGDTSPRSVSLASIAANGRVTAGAVAGNAVVTATGGGVTSNDLTIDIFNKPSKLYYTPDTGVGGGYSGAAGTTQPFAVTFLDSYGHDVTAEVSSLATASGISSSAAGQITAGGTNVKSFTLTFGTSTGTFTITVTTGTWIGAHTNGGAGTPTDFSGLFRTGNVN